MREFALPNYSNGHLVAIAGAIGLHVVLIAFALMPSKPMAMHEQFIQVNLARPSQQFSQKKSATIKLENNFIVAKKSDGAEKNQASINKNPTQNKLAEIEKDKKLDLTKKESQSTSQTSGQVSKDAVADNGAYSKPVFDAPTLQNGAPTYPEYARRNGIQGKVMLEVQVSKEGNASKVAVVGSSGYGVLDQAAFEAVKNWRFIPARMNGKVVETPMPVLVPVIFSFS